MSWKDTDTEDTSIDGTEIWLVENGAGDDNNWLSISRLKTWLDGYFAPVLDTDDNYVTDDEKAIIEELTLPTADNQLLQATGAGEFSWTSSVEGLVSDSSGIYSKDEVDDLVTVQILNVTTASSVTSAQSINSVVYCGATATHTLVSPPDGASMVVYPLGTYVITLDLDTATDIIWLNGVAQSAGVGIVGDGAASPVVLTKKADNTWYAYGPEWVAET